LFVLGKILSGFTQPLVWVIALLLVGFWAFGRRPALARALTATALGLLVFLGWLPAPNALLHDLESRYAEMPPQADLRPYVGMVVLGGAFEHGYIAQDHRQPVLNDGAERMVAPVAAAQRHPTLQIVFTGGEGTVFGTGPSEAERARVLFESLGLSGERVRYESASRTTYENAELTAQLPGLDRTQPWLLVTSAWHMPRSMAVFRKMGWNVTAYPVDFRTGSGTPWLEYSLREGVTRWQLVLHEWLGILAYSVRDWT
jgi:uncharacterized SAM-binding protein YcdF (DUF218 family)